MTNDLAALLRARRALAPALYNADPDALVAALVGLGAVGPDCDAADGAQTIRVLDALWWAIDEVAAALPDGDPDRFYAHGNRRVVLGSDPPTALRRPTKRVRQAALEWFRAAVGEEVRE